MRSSAGRNGSGLVRTHGGVTNFFLVGGIGFLIVGIPLLLMGGVAGSITGLTFTMIGAIWAAVALGIRGFYARMNRQAMDEQKLFETGKKATAVVESVETTGTVLNRVNQQIILRLRVQPRNEPEFAYQRKMFVPLHGIPRTGDLIDVAYAPADRSRVALATDWRSNTMGGRLLLLRRPGESEAMPAGMRAGAAPSSTSPSAPATAATSNERVIEQLERLGRLREDGVLTQTEFEAQKARVLSGQSI